MSTATPPAINDIRRFCLDKLFGPHLWRPPDGQHFEDDVSYARRTNIPPSRLIDLVGQRFGRLVVISYAGNGKWLCRCDCDGKHVVVRGGCLRSGFTRSCGCLRKERTLINIVGRRFGYLVVISYAGKGKWLCRCDCGTETVVRGKHLRSGHTKSCGCLQRTNAITHGMSYSGIYASWRSMMGRCYNAKHRNYKYYGALGVKVWERWHKFENFLADMIAAGMGKRPPGHTLDRINPYEDYKPGNVHWATPKEQANNKRKRQPGRLIIRLKGTAEERAAAIARTAVKNQVEPPLPDDDVPF